jgi:hypothetical protein
VPAQVFPTPIAQQKSRLGRPAGFFVFTHCVSTRLLAARTLVGALVILYPIVIVAAGDFVLLGILPVAADLFQ